MRKPTNEEYTFGRALQERSQRTPKGKSTGRPKAAWRAAAEAGELPLVVTAPEDVKNEGSLRSVCNSVGQGWYVVLLGPNEWLVMPGA